MANNITVTNATKQVQVLTVRTSFWGTLETTIPPGTTRTMVAPPNGFDSDQLPAAVATLQRHGLTDGSGGPQGARGSYLIF
jgi:hypothetical protein